MKLTKQQETQLYKFCLEEGLSLSYGKASLCDLKNFYHSNVWRDRRYQVHCEDSRLPFSKIYDELMPAVNKFTELKHKVKRMS
jgi:hypothetical protein